MTVSREEIKTNREEMTARRIEAKIEAVIRDNREDVKSEIESIRGKMSASQERWTKDKRR
jgi:hypothetical protein